MFKADSRRMITSAPFYIWCGIALVMPILILVMTTMAGGEGMAFTNAWQIIASSGGMAMDMTAMVNINLVYIMAGIFLSVFISEDFRSGYVKNLFTVRARKSDYVASKTIIGIIAGTAMLLAFFVGTLFGGSFAGLSFEIGTANVGNLLMCMLAKICLTAVFTPIFTAASVFAKDKSWLAICLSLMLFMLMFMIIPMMTPLNATIMNVILCLAGGAMFCFGCGFVSNLLLGKRDLV